MVRLGQGWDATWTADNEDNTLYASRRTGVVYLTRGWGKSASDRRTWEGVLSLLRALTLRGHLGRQTDGKLNTLTRGVSRVMGMHRVLMRWGRGGKGECAK